MKEFTVITTLEFTEILKADDIELAPDTDVCHALKETFGLDDVQITNTQVFVRDLTDQ